MAFQTEGLQRILSYRVFVHTRPNRPGATTVASQIMLELPPVPANPSQSVFVQLVTETDEEFRRVLEVLQLPGPAFFNPREQSIIKDIVVPGAE